MKKSLIFFSALFVCCIVFPAVAMAIEGYPGHTWGELGWEIPRKGVGHNLTLQGWVEQGIHWVTWGDVKLNTYASLRYKWDEEKFDWNNKISPGVGVALEVFHFKQLHIRTGVEYLMDKYYKSGIEEQKIFIFSTWYGWWDLKKP